MKISRGMNVYIDAKAYDKIQIWTDLAPGEISGFGLADVCPGGFVISDVYLPKQVNGAASTEIEAEDVAKLMIDLDKQGIDLSRLKFWWHSHVDMGCFWSSTDQATQNLISPADFLISLVVNKKKEYRAKVSLKGKIDIEFDEVPLIVNMPDFGQKSECEKQFKENASVKVWGYSSYYGEWDPINRVWKRNDNVKYYGRDGRWGYNDFDDEADDKDAKGNVISFSKAEGSVKPEVGKSNGTGVTPKGTTFQDKKPTNGVAALPAGYKGIDPDSKDADSLVGVFTEDPEVTPTEILSLFTLSKLTPEQAQAAIGKDDLMDEGLGGIYD